MYDYELLSELVRKIKEDVALSDQELGATYAKFKIQTLNVCKVVVLTLPKGLLRNSLE